MVFLILRPEELCYAVSNGSPELETAMGIGSFFANTDDSQKGAQVVDAPAFSLTKTLVVVAPVLTAVASAAVARLPEIEFTSGQWMGMIVALIAFVAVVSAADLLARGVATSAKRIAEGRALVTALKPTAKAMLAKDGADEDVKVLAMSSSPPKWLCQHDDGELSWQAVDKIRFVG